MGTTLGKVLSALVLTSALSAATPAPQPDVSKIPAVVMMVSPNFIASMNTSMLTVQVSFTWSAPTSHVDGTPIVVPLSYIVYQGIPGNMVAFDTLVDTIDTFYQPLVPGKFLCYGFTAVENGVESSLSALACVTMPLNGPVPNAPSGLTLT